MARLSPTEIAHYEAEGWLIQQFRLPAAQTEAMRDALDALIAANPGVRPEKLVSAHIEGDNGEGVHGSAKMVAQMTVDQRGAIGVFEGLGFRAEALLHDHVKDRDGRTHDIVILSHDVAKFQSQMAAYGVVQALE